METVAHRKEKGTKVKIGPSVFKCGHAKEKAIKLLQRPI